MARSTRDTNLETLTARLRLAVQDKPYWRALETGLHIGYRRITAGGGTWTARRRKTDGRYATAKLGAADDMAPADGLALLSFKQAQQKARDWDALQERIAHGLAPATGAYTVAAALEDYFASRDARGSKGVASDRSAATSRIVPELGAVVADKITTTLIRAWHTGIAKAPRMVRTAKFAAKRKTMNVDQKDPEAVRARRSSSNRILTILKAALNHAFQEGKVRSDEAWRKVKPFREVDAAVVRYLNGPESARLINTCEPDFRTLVHGALLTGCRYGELCRLAARDFNHAAGTLAVKFSKSGKPRHVALNDDGRLLFASITAGQSATALIFKRGDGTGWKASHQQRPLAEASVRAKLEPAATFHTLRHTYASSLAMAGVPMGVIAAQLGHADTRITERHYAHLSPSYVADTIRASLPRIDLGKPALDPVVKRLGVAS